jgi:two-component system chemotaxis response regulator CheY
VGAELPEEGRVNSVKNRKVLVVEDSRLIHKMYEVMLRPTTLLSAFNGHEGLDKLSQSPDVDFIILDINMPKMTGLEFLAQVKTTPALAKIPVIIVSTDGKEEDVARGLQSGAVAYLRKPFQREDLLKIINRIESEQTAA